MFLHKDSFTKYLATDTANLIAKIANQEISRNGKVVYGRLSEDGSGIDFSTTQKTSDTHVAVLIGCEVMGAFEPNEGLIEVGAPTRRDEVRAIEAELDRLRDENRQLRNK